MARLSPLFLAATLAFVAAPAVAGTHWLCGLSAELTRLVCVADEDPMDQAVPEATTATVRGTRFPLDPRRQWTVDLWSPPTECSSVEFLARATLCFRSPGCTVSVALPAFLQASATRR
jgi:hypothetical protein